MAVILHNFPEELRHARNATSGTVAKELLYKNKNIQYASLETVISKNELRQHLDIVEFPVVTGYVISVLFRIRYSHNDCL